MYTVGTQKGQTRSDGWTLFWMRGSKEKDERRTGRKDQGQTRQVENEAQDGFECLRYSFVGVAV